MNAFYRLVVVQTKRSVREPMTVLFMFAFAPMFVVIMGAIFGNDPRPEFGGQGFIQSNLVSFMAIVIAIAGFVVIPTDMIGQRTSGALRRFRATPLRPARYIGADVVVRVVILLASICAMLLIGVLVYGADPVGSIPVIAPAIVLGVLPFLAVGYALAAVMPSVGSAQALGNVLTYPLIVLSGAAVPLEVLPDGVRDVARFSPLTQVVDLLRNLWAGESWSQNWTPVAVLLGLLVVATAVATRFFRWE